MEFGDNKLYGFMFIDMMEAIQEETGLLLTLYQAYQEDGKLSVIVQPDEPSMDAKALYAALQNAATTYHVPLGKLYVMDKTYCATLFKSFTQFGRTTQTIKLPLIMKRKPFEELVKTIIEA